MCRCVLARGWRSGVHTITVCSTGGVSVGGKECTLPPLHSQHIHPQPSHRPHTHSSHILTIGLSIFLSLLAPILIQLQLISHFTSQRKGLHAASAAVQRVDKHKKGAKAFSFPALQKPARRSCIKLATV